MTHRLQDATPPERPLLRHIPLPRRGHFMNLFLAPPRAGCTDPHDVVAQVKAELQQQLQRRQPWASDESMEQLCQDLLTIIKYPSESIQLAKEAIDYVAIPPNERARVKARRHRPLTGHLPATDKQIAFLRALGHHGPVNSRTHASELINTLKPQKGGMRHA